MTGVLFWREIAKLKSLGVTSVEGQYSRAGQLLLAATGQAVRYKPPSTNLPTRPSETPPKDGDFQGAPSKKRKVSVHLFCWGNCVALRHIVLYVDILCCISTSYVARRHLVLHDDVLCCMVTYCVSQRNMVFHSDIFSCNFSGYIGLAI